MFHLLEHDKWHQAARRKLKQVYGGTNTCLSGLYTNLLMPTMSSVKSQARKLTPKYMTSPVPLHSTERKKSANHDPQLPGALHSSQRSRHGQLKADLLLLTRGVRLVLMAVTNLDLQADRRTPNRETHSTDPNMDQIIQGHPTPRKSARQALACRKHSLRLLKRFADTFSL